MIRARICAALAACFTAAMATAAHAGHIDVTISTAPTHNMTLANGVYSPTGDKAVLNIDDLMAALNAGNLDVTTASAGGKQSGDIVVEAAFQWASGYALTLDAFHSIRVNQPVTDAGAGALTLTTSDGGSNGHLQFGPAGNIGFWGLANALTIDGQVYTLVNSVASLAAAISANPSGNYALATSYDASVDKTYKQDPIGTTFEGTFEGLGNTISNLTMHFTRNAPGNIGFFATIGADASVSNFHLLKIAIVVPVATVNAIGGLAGESDGSLYGDDVSGTLVARRSDWLGGLIGTGSGSIAHCSSAAVVEARHFAASMGGGGLAGMFSGPITDSFATGNVRAAELSYAIGGLVGQSTGSISHSHATGNISGLLLEGAVGGLVGMASQPIVDSYATGNIKIREGAGPIIGGLVGETASSITRSFATGADSENRYIGGGLVGDIGVGPITDSYATGAVVGSQESAAAGLVANSERTARISTSYAAGKANGYAAGGFGCNIIPAEVSSDYWDTTSSGTTYGMCGNANITGVTGLTTAQLKSGLPPGFDPHVWAEDKRINHGLPYLIANPPPQ
jgi:hypothetical protein